MVHRSPARYLAPIALLAVIAALFLIVTRDGAGDKTSSSGRDETSTTTTTSPTPSRKKGRRTYTVKENDTPTSIAEKTGVPLEEILELNPKLEPNALVPGTKIKLRR